MISKFTLAIFLLIQANSFAVINFTRQKDFKHFNFLNFQNLFQVSVFNNDETWPNNFNYNQRNYRINYSIKEELNEYVKKLFKRHHPEFGAVVLIDNETGGILTAVDYEKKTKRFGKKWAFSTSHPAASVYKVITAATLLENTKKDVNSVYSFSGNPHTLYKAQLRANHSKRWNRDIAFGEAFAKSNNVIFGKVAINELDFFQLKEMSEKFMFDENVLSDFKTPKSKIMVTDSNYELAELASGFNTDTKISPLHGALIASVIANKGVLKRPYLIEEIKDLYIKADVYKNTIDKKRILSFETAANLREMMQMTISEGTARGTFKKYRNSTELEIGGKTGSITGGEPFGKRDWFIFYAKPKDGSSKGISGAIMLVNQKKWYVKSLYLAKKILT
jgi:cell division protein FtsI/penicillin-binding protein 2